MCSACSSGRWATCSRYRWSTGARCRKHRSENRRAIIPHHIIMAAHVLVALLSIPFADHRVSGLHRTQQPFPRLVSVSFRRVWRTSRRRSDLSAWGKTSQRFQVWWGVVCGWILSLEMRSKKETLDERSLLRRYFRPSISIREEAVAIVPTPFWREVAAHVCGEVLPD